MDSEALLFLPGISLHPSIYANEYLQNDTYLFFIMEYIQGGDLMSLLIRKEIFDEDSARFYTAELVCAIHSVHSLVFIHRDINPDNVLIDLMGHINLTDFGLCTGLRWTHDK